MSLRSKRLEREEEERLELIEKAHDKMGEVFEVFLDELDPVKNEMFSIEGDNSGYLNLSLEALSERNAFQELSEIKNKTIVRIGNGAVDRMFTTQFLEEIIVEFLVQEMMDENSYLGKAFAKQIEKVKDAKNAFYDVSSVKNDFGKDLDLEVLLRGYLNDYGLKNLVKLDDKEKQEIEKIINNQYNDFLKNNQLFVKIYFLNEDRQMFVFAMKDCPVEYWENLRDKNNIKPNYLFQLKEHSSPFTIKKGDKYVVIEEGGSEYRKVLKGKDWVYKKTGVEKTADKNMEIKTYHVVKHLSKKDQINSTQNDFEKAGYKANDFNEERILLNVRQEIKSIINKEQDLKQTMGMKLK